MKKIKMLFVALLTAFCCVALSACDVVSLGLYVGFGTVAWLTDEDKDAPSLDELRMSVEITEGAEIVEITQNEEGFYLAKTVGAIKSLGEKDSDDFGFRLAYYDENGFLLDTVFLGVGYLGAGDTYKVEYEAELFFKPATARIYDVRLYETYDYSYEKTNKKNVEILDGESFTCELGEDGLYHATLMGQVKLLAKGTRDMYICVAFYDADGYLYVRDWTKQVSGPAERPYTIECTSETEIVSYKIVYATT